MDQIGVLSLVRTLQPCLAPARSIALVVGLWVQAADAYGFPDDAALGYSASYTPQARFSGRLFEAGMLRQTLALELGWGDFGVGVRLHDAESLVRTVPGESEFGVMLTGAYSPVLTNYLRLELNTRIGLTHGSSNPGQPLFATDTDLRVRLVAFDPVGLRIGSERLFLSGHLGGNLNWVGRTQASVGGGLWWRQLGLYVTAFQTLVGVDVQDLGNSVPRNAFARLRASELSVAFSWDIRLSQTDELQLEIRQGVPLENGGFTGILAATWRFSFEDASDESFEAAW